MPQLQPQVNTTSKSVLNDIAYNTMIMHETGAERQMDGYIDAWIDIDLKKKKHHLEYANLLLQLKINLNSCGCLSL